MKRINIPGKATISGRSSTMASQFARARAPYVKPTLKELEDRYRLLAMDPDNPECVYCGEPPTEWDHLFPMVAGSQWTGYSTEIANLVPACTKCNGSRGSKLVPEWMRSAARWSPYLKFQVRDGMKPEEAIAEIERRISLIQAAVAAQPPTRMTMNIDDRDEQELEVLRGELNALLTRAEVVATRLRLKYQP